jgi:hypothetical protein
VIRYELPIASNVRLELVDVLGRSVATLVDATQDAGAYAVHLNASSLNLSSGMYFYSLKANGFSRMKKMILMK